MSPAVGPVAGGTTITLTGTNFQTGATVSVGGVAATGVTITSATQATAVTPAGAAGTVSVQLANPGGSNGVLLNAFTYQTATPIVTAVSPSFGPTAGGTTITLTGTNFVAGATVSVGSVAATGVTIVSGTQATATTPAGTAGAANVAVHNPGNATGVLLNGFTYVQPPSAPPTITAITPTAGPTAGGTLVTLGGTNFLPGCTVTFGGTAAATVTVVSTTILTAVTPAGSAGPVTVAVQNPGSGTGSAPNGFTYSGAPVLSAVSPAAGPTTGGRTVTLTGSNFVAGATVQFGTATATVQGFNATAMVVTTPAAAAGTVGVTVTNPGGYAATLAGAYTFVTPPAVTGVSPASGPAGGGTAVTVTGTNFNTGATLTVGGGVATNVVVVNSTTLTATTPAGAPGGATVTVIDPAAGAGAVAGTFQYLPPPSVWLVTPNTAPSTGGATITLNGSGFQSGATVTVGGTAATGVTFVSATVLTAVTPAGTIGVASITVTNPDTQSGTIANGFAYVAPPPTLTAITPTAGYTTQYTVVTITGTGFVSGATADIGGKAIVSVSVLSGTTLTGLAAPNTAGTYGVRVTNPGGGATTLSSAFTYQVPPPVVSGVTPPSGQLVGGYGVTIYGSGFVSGATVTIDGVAATNVGVPYSNQVTCTVPAGTTLGPVTVVVTNPGGAAASRANAFTYVNGLRLTNVNGWGATTKGGTTAYIYGEGFQSGTTVQVNGLAASSVNVVSDTYLRCTLPATVAGPASLTVTVPTAYAGTLSTGYAAQSCTEFKALTIGTASTPSATAPVVPAEGPSAGGGTVTLTGTGFQSGATVLFGTTAATNVAWVSGTTLTCVVPPRSAATAPVVGVTVTNPDGSTWAASPPVSGYTYARAGCGTGTATYYLQQAPRVAVGASGLRHVVCAEEDWTGGVWMRHLQYRRSTDGGVSFGTAVTLASASTTAASTRAGYVTVAAAGSNVVVAWTMHVWNAGLGAWESEPWAAASTDGGQSFGTAVHLAGFARSSGIAWLPLDVAVTPNGTIAVAAEGRTASGSAVFVASGGTLATLGTPARLSPVSGAVMAPRVAASGNAAWHVVWQDGVGASTTVDMSATSDGGQNWTAPMSLSAAGSVHSAQISGNGSTLLVSWGVYGAVGCTWRTSTDGGQTWSTVATVGAVATTGSYVPSMAIDGAGVLLAAWEAPATLFGLPYVDVLASHSADGGVTWSPPTPIARSTVSYPYSATAPCVAAAGTAHFTVFLEPLGAYGRVYGY